jgi:hypothetical protein
MNKTAVVILTGVGTVQAWKTKASGERLGSPAGSDAERRRHGHIEHIVSNSAEPKNALVTGD